MNYKEYKNDILHRALKFSGPLNGVKYSTIALAFKRILSDMIHLKMSSMIHPAENGQIGWQKQQRNSVCVKEASVMKKWNTCSEKRAPSARGNGRKNYYVMNEGYYIFNKIMLGHQLHA